jgi:hypothetical protein
MDFVLIGEALIILEAHQSRHFYAVGKARCPSVGKARRVIAVGNWRFEPAPPGVGGGPLDEASVPNRYEPATPLLPEPEDTLK